MRTRRSSSIQPGTGGLIRAGDAPTDVVPDDADTLADADEAEVLPPEEFRGAPDAKRPDAEQFMQRGATDPTDIAVPELVGAHLAAATQPEEADPPTSPGDEPERRAVARTQDASADATGSPREDAMDGATGLNGPDVSPEEEYARSDRQGDLIAPSAKQDVPAAATIDEALLRDMVSDIVRQELQGVLGERITRNVRKLVRREIHRVLMSHDLD